MIVKCICSHEYQNARYGNKNRVCNQMKDPNEYRCTICEKINIVTNMNIQIQPNKKK